jgi:hypothetical protein
MSDQIPRRQMFFTNLKPINVAGVQRPADLFKGRSVGNQIAATQIASETEVRGKSFARIAGAIIIPPSRPRTR